MRRYTQSLLLSLALVVGLAGDVVSDQKSTSSPGIQVGITSWDWQHRHSQTRQIARLPGADVIHFGWTMTSYIPDWEWTRYMGYNSWNESTATLSHGTDGDSIGPGPFGSAAYVCIDADGENRCHAVLQDAAEWELVFSAWHLAFPGVGSSTYEPYELPIMADPLPDETDMLWPDLAVKRTVVPSENVYHVIAMGAVYISGAYATPSERLFYWRYDESNPLPIWEGPVLVDSSSSLQYSIAADQNSDRIALAFATRYYYNDSIGVPNIAYRESQTSGSGWLSGAELGDVNRYYATTYSGPYGLRARGDISVAYNHQSDLHIVFSEDEYLAVGPVTIRHWSSSRMTVEAVVSALYPTAGSGLWVTNADHITLGIGDGSTPCDGGTTTNEDYLYVLYTKVGGETAAEAADTSARGYANGELYLVASPNGGSNWSLPINLTNTKTPDCDGDTPGSECASESWGSITRIVDDLNILYLLDHEAGIFDETGWTINEMMYLRIPGGTVDDPYFCPELPCDCRCHSDPACDGATNVLDVVYAVNVAFRSATPVFDYVCPYAQTDVDCSNATDVLDVVHFVNVAFRGGDPEIEFCDPCTP